MVVAVRVNIISENIETLNCAELNAPNKPSFINVPVRTPKNKEGISFFVLKVNTIVIAAGINDNQIKILNLLNFYAY